MKSEVHSRESWIQSKNLKSSEAGPESSQRFCHPNNEIWNIFKGMLNPVKESGFQSMEFGVHSRDSLIESRNLEVNDLVM